VEQDNIRSESSTRWPGYSSGVRGITYDKYLIGHVETFSWAPGGR